MFKDVLPIQLSYEIKAKLTPSYVSLGLSQPEGLIRSRLARMLPTSVWLLMDEPHNLKPGIKTAVWHRNQTALLQSNG